MLMKPLGRDMAGPRHEANKLKCRQRFDASRGDPVLIEIPVVGIGTRSCLQSAR